MVKAQVKAYLAHTFKHRKYVKDTLTPRIHALGIETKNPFYEPDGTTKRAEVELADKAGINQSSAEVAKEVAHDGTEDQEKWLRMVRAGNKTIVQRDLKFINRTDFTVAYLTELSAGTCCEIFWTGVVKRRAVFLLCNNPEVTMHPWIMYSCRRGKIVKDIDELVRVLKRRYG